MKNLLLIGYSGHAFVVVESALNEGYKMAGYFESEQKAENPFMIEYLGNEDSFDFKKMNEYGIIAGIGNNYIRRKIYEKQPNLNWCNVIDPSSNVSPTTKLSLGIYIGKRAVINPLSVIGKGCIINTAAIVEHECNVGDFVHVAPMAVLCGNVNIGANTFVGANSVIKQGISIGSNVVIGAGSVITKDVPDNALIYGNPARIIKK